MDQEISVILADDHALFRDGLILLLKDAEEIKIIAEAESGQELINYYMKYKPDLLIIDIAMTDMSGIEALARIKKLYPEVKSLFLSGSGGKEYIYKILKAGGLGLLNKNIQMEELVTAVHKISNGGRYFGPDWPEEKLDQLIKEYDNSDIVRLNFREEKILKLISEGKSSQEIAEIINISKKTVDYYRGSLLHKLNMKNANELIIFGIEYFSSGKYKNI